MTNYTRGRTFEYRVMAHYRALGYTTLRTAGSHGLADIIAIHPARGEVLLIQCKAVRMGIRAEQRILDDMRRAIPTHDPRFGTARPYTITHLLYTRRSPLATPMHTPTSP